NEVTGADEGIEDVDAFVAKRAAKFFLQDFFDAAHHEIYDGLRRVDDAAGIGFFGGVSLKEAHVHGVEEVLLLAVLGGVVGVELNGAVEGLEALEEFVAIERAPGEFDNNLLNFNSDHIAGAEIVVLENPAEDALGE